jgi:hypothetical protein
VVGGGVGVTGVVADDDAVGVEGVAVVVVTEEVGDGVPTAGSSAQAATAPSGASSRRWRRVSMDAF